MAYTTHVHKCIYLGISQKRRKSSRFLFEGFPNETPPTNGHLSALWAWTLPTCSQITCSVQMLAPRFCTLLCTASTTPCLRKHDGQGEGLWQVWLWLGEWQIPQGSTCLLGSTEHFYSLWEIGRKQQKRAFKVKHVFVQVHVYCFQRLQALINKRKNHHGSLWTFICLYYIFI